MNIARNMEAIFIIAVAMVTATGIATAATGTQPRLAPQAVVQLAQAAQVNNDAGMMVVSVTAKRLTAAEKAAL